MNDIQRATVERLQRLMVQMPQAKFTTTHYHVKGMYCRVVERAAGVLIVGKVHKQEHFYMVVHGAVRVTTDEGVRDLAAPAILCCKPGTKRAVLALQDSVCLTVHRTDKKNHAKIEKELVEEDDTAAFGPGNVPRLKELP